MTLRVRLEPGRFGRKAADVADLTVPQLRKLMSTIVVAAQANIQDETPTGAFGTLKGSYTSDVRVRGRTVRGTVENPTIYHDNVEDGRRPGKPPPSAALVPWVAVKLGVPVEQREAVAFLVARAIGRRGTEGAHMVESGWEATRRQTRPMLRDVGLELVRSLR